MILCSLAVEVYPRPDGTIYICGIGGSDYIQKDALKEGAFLTDCNANQARVEAAMASFQDMSSVYQKWGELDHSQACMRPCPPDAMPYMGAISGCEGAYINAGHNCWYVNPRCGVACGNHVPSRRTCFNKYAIVLFHVKSILHNV